MSTLRPFEEYAEVVPHLQSLETSQALAIRSDRTLRGAWSRLRDLAQGDHADLVADPRWYADTINSAHMAFSSLALYGERVPQNNTAYQGFAISDASGRMAAVVSDVAAHRQPVQVWLVGGEEGEGTLTARFNGDGRYAARVMHGDYDQLAGWPLIERASHFSEVPTLRVRSHATLMAVSRGIIAAAEGELWQSSPVEDAVRLLAEASEQPR